MTRCVKKENQSFVCVEANDVLGNKLLDEADWDIYYWATNKRTPPDRWVDSPLLEKLKVHARNEGKVVRRMPPL